MLSLSQSIGLHLVEECSFCAGSDGEHNADCPIGLLEKLNEKQVRAKCPECQAVAVGVNTHDYYECRTCHTQFSRGQHHNNGQRKKTYLDIVGLPDLINVVVLEEKGDGKFPIDDRIKALQEQTSRPRRRKR